MARLLRYVILLSLITVSLPSLAVDVTIDTAAAHAVLDAIGNPRLTREQARRIAAMPQNEGPIRKLHEFGLQVTSSDLADALFDTAHKLPLKRREESYFMLDWMTPKIAVLQKLLDQIDRDPQAFTKNIERRIGSYTPPGARINLHGYVVAAGDGAGYAFGSDDFYLNLVMTDELAMAKSVTTHEMYHSVQGYFSRYRVAANQTDDTSTSCRAVQHLFDDIYREGSAVEVADVSLLDQFKTANGLRQKTDMEDGFKHLDTSADLLEMSIVSLTADRPVPFDEVYRVGFLGHAVLYNIAYAMAHAIALADGPQGLASYIRRPPADFIRRYTTLPAYGKDDQHPSLGQHTIEALALVGRGCP